MRTLLIFIALILETSFLLAEGPMYQHKDRYVNQEFQNAYQDIRAKIPIYSSSTYLSTGAASTAYITLSSASATYVQDDGPFFKVSSAGEVTQPLQPSFLATTSGAQSNVTGDGTVYTVLFGTEIFDQGGDFASSTFTAPVGGKYLLIAQIVASGITSNTTDYDFSIVTSNRTYIQSAATPSTLTSIAPHISVITEMEAGDIAYVTYAHNGTSKVVDLSSTGGRVYFSGTLIN